MRGRQQLLSGLAFGGTQFQPVKNANLSAQMSYYQYKEPPLIEPSVPFRRPFVNWFKWVFLRDNWIYPTPNDEQSPGSGEDTRKSRIKAIFLGPFPLPGWDDLKKFPLRAFLLIYGFDGFDPTSATVSYHDHSKPELLKSSNFSKWLLVASFFGLPTRPEMLKEGDGFVPQLTFKQLLKNFIGGWTPLYHYEMKDADNTGIKTRKIVWDFNEKTIGQLIALPIKFLIILPIKLIGIPIKTAINIIKLFTEFLPMLIIPLARFLAGVALAIAAVISAMIPALIAFISITIISAPNSALAKVILALLIGIPLFLPAVVILAGITLAGIISMASVYIATTLLPIISRAIFSPAKSMKMAFDFGRELRGSIFGFNIGNLFGVIGAAISLGITIIAWTLAFPLLVNTIVGYAPAILQALTWVLQLPIIGHALLSIQAGLLTIGTALSAAFGPVITPIALLLSAKLSASAIALGAALGMLVSPVVTIGSIVADKLSDWWANGHNGKPFSSLFPGTQLDSVKKAEPVKPNQSNSRGTTPHPTPHSRSLSGQQDIALGDAYNSTQGADRTAHGIDTPPYWSQSQTGEESRVAVINSDDEDLSQSRSDTRVVEV